MHLVCAKHRVLWRDCGCDHASGNWAWIFVDEQELKYFFSTGMIPDTQAELLWFEGQPKPKPIPLQHPRKYDFHVDL